MCVVKCRSHWTSNLQDTVVIWSQIWSNFNNYDNNFVDKKGKNNDHKM